MILWFNQPGRNNRYRRNLISAHRGFQGNIGLYFAVMQKLGGAPFLWWSEILRVEADFERAEIRLHVDGQKQSVRRVVPFPDFLGLDYAGIVDKHMRPFSAAIARSWELYSTAEVIESGADRAAIEHSVAKECRGPVKGYAIALTNILYKTGEVPWQDVDFSKP